MGVRELGVIGNAAFLYNQIDGKFLGRAIFGLAVSAGIPAAPYITLGIVIFWWIVWFGLFRHICRGCVYRNWQAGLAASLFTVILFLGLPRIERTLYWLNGTTYVFLSTALFGGYVWLILRPELKNTPLTFALFLALGFLVYDVSDTVGIAALVALAGAYLASYLRAGIPRELRPRLLAALIGTIIGLISIYLAPGSLGRRNFMGTSTIDFGYGMYFIASGVAAPGTIAFAQAPLAYLSLIGISGLVGYCSPVPATWELRRRTRQVMLLSIVAAFVLLAACFAPPNLMLRTALNDHAYTAPLTVTICLFIVWGYCIGLLLKKPSTDIFIRRPIQAAAIVLISVIAVSGALHAINTTADLRAYAQARDNRDREIRQAISDGRTSPFVGPLTNYYDSRIPIDVGEKGSLHVAPIYSPYRWDLTDKPNDWVNKCVAWY